MDYSPLEIIQNFYSLIDLQSKSNFSRINKAYYARLNPALYLEYPSKATIGCSYPSNESNIKFVDHILKLDKSILMTNINDNPETLDLMQINNFIMAKKTIDFSKLLVDTNTELKFSGIESYGHNFYFTIYCKKTKAAMFFVKMCPYPKYRGFVNINNLFRPQNVELWMIKLLTNNFVAKPQDDPTERSSKYLSCSIVSPIATFNTDTKMFIDAVKYDINYYDRRRSKYKYFIGDFHAGLCENVVSILLGELRGNRLVDYFYENYGKMLLRDWTVLIFQILYTLAVIHQKYPEFRHNKLDYDSIRVIQTTSKISLRLGDKVSAYCYNLDNVKFHIPNINLQTKIYDFNLSSIDSIENLSTKINRLYHYGVTTGKNKYYDMHYYFSGLIKFHYHCLKLCEVMPIKIVEFIDRIVPADYRVGDKLKAHNGRLSLIDPTEYTTPYKVLMEDPLFEKYRFTNL